MSQLTALGTSLVMEVPVAVVIGAGLAWVPRNQTLRLFAVAMTATLLTHPCAWWGYRGLRYGLDLGRDPAFYTVEIAVTLVEALLFWRLAGITPVRALLVSLAANSLSAFWGWEFARLLGWA